MPFFLAASTLKKKNKTETNKTAEVPFQPQYESGLTSGRLPSRCLSLTACRLSELFGNLRSPVFYHHAEGEEQQYLRIFLSLTTSGVHPISRVGRRVPAQPPMPPAPALSSAAGVGARVTGAAGHRSTKSWDDYRARVAWPDAPTSRRAPASGAWTLGTKPPTAEPRPESSRRLLDIMIKTSCSLDFCPLVTSLIKVKK